MTDSSGNEHSLAHGFFHTMVVMGSALALGCGGESRSSAGAPEGTAGMNTDGAGGGAGSGGVAGLPGVSAGTGGGVSSTGGGPALGGMGGWVITIGGSPATGGAGAAAGGGGAPVKMPDCPSAQWDCTPLQCGISSLLQVQNCTCDATRPKSAAECGANETFVCLDGITYDASGIPTQPEFPFGCTCVEAQTNCYYACLAAEPNLNTRCLNETSTTPNPTDPILCGCAPIVLK